MPFRKCEICNGDAVTSDGMFLCLSGCGHVKGKTWEIQTNWNVNLRHELEILNKTELIGNHWIVNKKKQCLLNQEEVMVLVVKISMMNQMNQLSVL